MIMEFARSRRYADHYYVDTDQDCVYTAPPTCQTRHRHDDNDYRTGRRWRYKPKYGTCSQTEFTNAYDCLEQHKRGTGRDHFGSTTGGSSVHTTEQVRYRRFSQSHRSEIDAHGYQSQLQSEFMRSPPFVQRRVSDSPTHNVYMANVPMHQQDTELRQISGDFPANHKRPHYSEVRWHPQYHSGYGELYNLKGSSFVSYDALVPPRDKRDHSRLANQVATPHVDYLQQGSASSHQITSMHQRSTSWHPSCVPAHESSGTSSYPRQQSRQPQHTQWVPKQGGYRRGKVGKNDA